MTLPVRWISTCSSNRTFARDANVDVVVTPVLPSDGLWTLRDRLGRNLGQIKGMSGRTFAIFPEGGLADIPSQTFSSLDAAMSAIEKHMKGSCELAGPGERPIRPAAVYYRRGAALPSISRRLSSA